LLTRRRVAMASLARLALHLIFQDFSESPLVDFHTSSLKPVRSHEIKERLV